MGIAGCVEKIVPWVKHMKETRWPVWATQSSSCHQSQCVAVLCPQDAKYWKASNENVKFVKVPTQLVHDARGDSP